MNGSSAVQPGGPLKLQPAPKTVQGKAGEVVTVELLLLNRSEEDPSHAPIIDVGALPEGWTIVGRDDFGGTWRPATREWFWWGLAPEEKVRPTLDVRIPGTVEPGEYTLSASADDGKDDGDSATVRLRVTPMGKGKKGKNRGKGKGKGRGKGKKGENPGKGRDNGNDPGKGNGRRKDDDEDEDEGSDGDRGKRREKGDGDGRDKGRDESSDGKDGDRGNGKNSGNGKGDSKSGGAVGSLVGWLTGR